LFGKVTDLDSSWDRSTVAVSSTKEAVLGNVSSFLFFFSRDSSLSNASFECVLGLDPDKA
jgi:hypothetical protein